MILLVTHPDDGDAEPVEAALAAAGERCARFNLADFPEGAGADLRLDEAGLAGHLTLPGHGEVPLAEIQGVWFRRPLPFRIAEAIADPAHRRFALEECWETINGLWQVLDARWVNHPVRNEVANHKPYQLAAARRAGLKVPRTCFTNEPDSARAFLGSLPSGGAIFKVLGGLPGEQWMTTRRVDARALDQLELIRHTPVIFQEYVPGRVDLRVTICGERLFAVAIDASATPNPLDWRTVWEQCRSEVVVLDPPVDAALRRLMAGLGLVYGCVDLRQRPDGEVVFLEINPNGQSLWMEARTGLPVTAALVELLRGS